MSENNNLPRPEKSRRMLDEEREAIEKWRKQYPELSDKELLEIDRRWKAYEDLLIEIALNDDGETQDSDDRA